MGIWGWILGIVIVYIFFKRADIVAWQAGNQYARGKVDKAIALFGTADKIGTLSVNNLLKYGYLLLRSGNPNRAEAILNLAFMRAGKIQDKYEIKKILALVHWKSGDIDAGIEMLEEIIPKYKNTTIYQNLGILYLIRGDGDKALEFNKEAHDYNDSDPIILDNLAESYKVCGDISRAKELYKELIEQEPHFPEPYFSYGKMLIEEGNKQEGMNLIQAALDKQFTYLNTITKEEVESYLASMA